MQAALQLPSLGEDTDAGPSASLARSALLFLGPARRKYVFRETLTSRLLPSRLVALVPRGPPVTYHTIIVIIDIVILFSMIKGARVLEKWDFMDAPWRMIHWLGTRPLASEALQQGLTT